MKTNRSEQQALNLIIKGLANDRKTVIPKQGQDALFIVGFLVVAVIACISPILISLFQGVTL